MLFSNWVNTNWESIFWTEVLRVLRAIGLFALFIYYYLKKKKVIGLQFVGWPDSIIRRPELRLYNWACGWVVPNYCWWDLTAICVVMYVYLFTTWLVDTQRERQRNIQICFTNNNFSAKIIIIITLFLLILIMD